MNSIIPHWQLVDIGSDNGLVPSGIKPLPELTKATRTPAFWGYPPPPPPHDYPYYWVILDTPPTASWLPILLSYIGSQVKTRQSQSYKFKEFTKISNILIWKQRLHVTHLLLDKMCKYEMDPMSIVEDTEWTRFCPQTDRQTDGRTDGQGETSIPPFQLRWSRGYNNEPDLRMVNSLNVEHAFVCLIKTSFLIIG